MKIVMMNGGLGNQVFQYIFYRALVDRQENHCYLDDSAFFISNQHNGYEIETIFDIKPNKLSEYFTADVWEYMLDMIKSGKNLCNLLQENEANIYMLSEGNTCEASKYQGEYFVTQMNKYNPSILDYDKNIYYYGYWINRDWFKMIESTIRKELRFRELTDSKNIAILDLIKSTNSVGIHVRRGDFIDYDWALPEEYYYESVKKIVNMLSNPMFVVFSDDIKWCKDNYKELGFGFCKDKITFVDWNIKEYNYIDMQLMSNCKHLIIANSSFSYLGALLNTNKNKVILTPTPSRELF